MKIVEERGRGLVIVRPSGRLDASSSPELEQTLLAAYARGDGDVVIDMSEVPYVSSRGLRVFLAAAKKSESSGGRLVVAGLQAFVEKVFEVSGFLPLLNVFDTCAEAIAFREGAPRSDRPG